jgi:hypothetical protein
MNNHAPQQYDMLQERVVKHMTNGVMSAPVAATA